MCVSAGADGAWQQPAVERWNRASQQVKARFDQSPAGLPPGSAVRFEHTAKGQAEAWLNIRARFEGAA